VVNPFGRFIRFRALLLLAICALSVSAQQAAPPAPANKAAQAPAEAEKLSKPELPFQIQLLETHIRFEANGDSRKEVHTIVKIINILGAHEFARLSFDYNRAFQQIEIPQVRITHANGGTSEVLPSAVTDAPNPAVEPFPAYHDVRIKSVRVLGLQENDIVEYRVITTTTHHPLAPNFWLEHTFDRSGQVLEEHYEVDVPSPLLRIRINPETPAFTSNNSGEGDSARVLYRWEMNFSQAAERQTNASAGPDVALTTFHSWADLSKRMNQISWPGFSTQIWFDIMKAAGAPKEPVPPRVIYKFVSQKIATVDLPVDLSGYVRRSAEQVLKSGYGTPLEKARLLEYATSQNDGVSGAVVMYGRGRSLDEELPRPTLLSGALASVFPGPKSRSGALIPVFLALDVPEAPFGMIPADLRGHQALVIGDFANDAKNCFVEIPREPPFASIQNVAVDAAITTAGELKAKVKYSLRGDNELLLRVAFSHTPKEKWNDVANLLALADGFRGQITGVNASDPLATQNPFAVEYELTEPKFVDWSKKPVRIPALLPQIGLPDATPAVTPGQTGPHIQLGTPLEVQTTMTLHLPAGTAIETPPGTSVARDYATFTSKYSSTQNTATASRHINFLARELPVDRAMDYNAFVRAVQNDQAQRFTLENGK
jgi:hypothetical protein